MRNRRSLFQRVSFFQNPRCVWNIMRWKTGCRIVAFSREMENYFEKKFGIKNVCKKRQISNLLNLFYNKKNAATDRK